MGGVSERQGPQEGERWVGPALGLWSWEGSDCVSFRSLAGPGWDSVISDGPSNRIF